MQDAEFLFTCAEVGVALAGFAGLVSVIARRFAPDSSEGGSGVHRLQLMLLYSLTASAFSLLPYLLLRSSLADRIAWRLACVAFFVAWLGIFLPNVRRALQFASGESLRSRILFFYVQTALLVTGMALLALGALGVFGENAPLAYLAAVSIMLFHAGRLLVRLFLALVQPAA